MRPTFFVLMTVALFSAPLHAQNFVLNGEFDDSLAGWDDSSARPTQVRQAP